MTDTPEAAPETRPAAPLHPNHDDSLAVRDAAAIARVGRFGDVRRHPAGTPAATAGAA